MKANWFLVGLSFAVVAAAVKAPRYTQPREGMAGTWDRRNEINHEFDRLLGDQGVRIDCGKTPNDGTGDYVYVDFEKVKRNLTLLQAKKP